MAAPIQMLHGRAQCPSCGCSGVLGASCDVCWRVAYDREITRVICAEHQATAVHGPRCDTVMLLREHRDGLIAVHDGHVTLRAIFPGARMQAPEPP